mgnify:CR=1 FL=1|tara:strand:+ start:313 stop:507 length:195 start_codon:yes stop_codon:yes gene_type:complete
MKSLNSFKKLERNQMRLILGGSNCANNADTIPVSFSCDGDSGTYNVCPEELNATIDFLMDYCGN